MAVPRQLDTSEALPAISAASTPLPATGKPPQKRPLQADSELTRAQKNTERLRRKRHKRSTLHQQHTELVKLAKHSKKHAVRLGKEQALKALEQAKNVVIDESARRRKIAPEVLFKKTQRKSLLQKDRGFSKR